MLSKIGDTDLLFGYLGNKMLSLYEDWRGERRERETLSVFLLIRSII